MSCSRSRLRRAEARAKLVEFSIGHHKPNVDLLFRALGVLAKHESVAGLRLQPSVGARLLTEKKHRKCRIIIQSNNKAS
jgi:hypothetical protein